jgi:flagella basal body P-ring formation protein FlgA
MLRVWALGMSAAAFLWAQTEFTAEQLRAQVQQYVAAVLDTLAAGVEIGRVPSLRFASGTVVVRCTGGLEELARGRVWVEFLSAGESIRRVPVPVRVTVNAPVVRLRQTVEAGSKLEASAVEVCRQRIGLQEALLLLPPAELSRCQLRRTLPAGSWLRRLDCLPLDGVKRGSQVTLVARAGAVVVRTTAQALEDGLPGEWIRVLRSASRTVLRARVVDATTVEVVPTHEAQP